MTTHSSSESGLQATAAQWQQPQSAQDLRACYPLMQQLRPHLHSEAEFVTRIQRQWQDGYRLLTLVQDELVLALAGYRLQENLVYGKFLYVDDLVTAPAVRSNGYGARLLEQLSLLAQQSACQRLVLDTGLANALAQRFYFRQGLLSSSMRFGKPIDAMT